MRNYAQNMRQRSQAVQSLFEFSRKLSTITMLDDILWASALQIQKAGEASCVMMLIPDEGGLKVSAAWPPVDQMDAGELAAARWALEKSEPAGWRTDTLPNVRFQFRPLATARGVVAVCGIEPKTPREPLSAAAESTISSLIEQTAIAIDRSMLVGESVKAAALEENEKLRTILLSALSHDLRTPLTSITGAVTSLRELGEKLPPEDRKDLLLSIEEEAGRLSRFIANMLDMSRIEFGRAVAAQRSRRCYRGDPQRPRKSQENFSGQGYFDQHRARAAAYSRRRQSPRTGSLQSDRQCA